MNLTGGWTDFVLLMFAGGQENRGSSEYLPSSRLGGVEGGRHLRHVPRCRSPHGFLGTLGVGYGFSVRGAKENFGPRLSTDKWQNL